MTDTSTAAQIATILALGGDFRCDCPPPDRERATPEDIFDQIVIDRAVIVTNNSAHVISGWIPYEAECFHCDGAVLWTRSANEAAAYAAEHLACCRQYA